MWNFSPFRKTRTETLIEEGERKLKQRIEMAENKEKLDMSHCTFKP